MPQALSETQKETIAATIMHMIDLASEASALAVSVNKLKRVISEELLANHDEDAMLQKCFLQPTACFHRLENLNPDISIASVQIYILAYLSTEIEKAAQLAGTTLERLGWDPSLTLQAIAANEDAARPFISEPLRIDSGEEPWQIPIDPRKIFKAEFRQLEDFRQIQLKVFIDLSEPTTHKRFTH